MTRQNHEVRLAGVKSAMAKKYESLARLSGSKPRQRTLLNKAAKYRRQAADLLRRARP